MANQLETVTVGLIERAFGVRGEVKVRPLSDVPGRFEGLRSVSLLARNGQTLETSVTHVRRVAAGFILGLTGVTTPEAASLWRGGFIRTVRGAVPELPEGQYYECDLIGLAVSTQEGRPIGVLEEILDVPGNPVFVVRQGAKEILIPAAKELVSAVDMAARTMTVRLIDGLGE
ncbi:ribosome maturation factor RimM [Candidatus Nitrospira nitrificans]|uniref:Ribosome maturation factor RimM n=1 Tax=Candidatus Nitrospira nitrificans TaxID=1742973 RepID=A0A0S4LR06_9BACT|nr:ribosome maturation factor RimM [Candidatus Nitrospira nitrificans]CUS39955.1 Ribosome maturation factor RimM [Candidatus Nitrospira nitrificans]